MYLTKVNTITTPTKPTVRFVLLNKTVAPELNAAVAMSNCLPRKLAGKVAGRREKSQIQAGSSAKICLGPTKFTIPAIKDKPPTSVPTWCGMVLSMGLAWSLDLGGEEGCVCKIWLYSVTTCGLCGPVVWEFMKTVTAHPL
jgi:hypothetical protein